MASHRTANFESRPYSDPNPLPSSVPHVDELGVTSAPLKSASFAIGQYCKDVNGQSKKVEKPAWAIRT
jgi:NADH dehydrogenase (ubiquinone) 1 alpha subcomplex subunit 8